MNAARHYQSHQPALMSVNKSESTPTSTPFPFFQVLRHFKAYCREHPEVKATHRSMFYYLLEIVEHRGNLARFQLNREDGLEGSGLGSKSTYYNVLRELDAWGLITYTKGANGEKSAIIEVLPKASTVPELVHCLGRWRDADRDTAWDAGGTTKKTIDLETFTLESEARALAEKKIGELENQLAQLQAQTSASHTEGGAAAGPPPQLAEGESIPGGFVDPRLADEDPRKWDARPRDVEMVQEYIDAYPDEAVRQRGQGKAHIFFEHYGSVGWQVMGRHGLVPIQNWRYLIRSFQFRESIPTTSHANQSKQRGGPAAKRAAETSRSGSARQPLAEGLQVGEPLTGSLDDL